MNPMQPETRIERQSRLSRRSFTRRLGLAGACLIWSPGQEDKLPQSRVALAKGIDRAAAIRNVIESLGGFDCQGKDILLKANFNSADEYPASTHPETLASVALWLRESNCANLKLVERSGMGRTREVWAALGIPELAKKLEISLLPLEDLPAGHWQSRKLAGSHWKRGVEVPDFLSGEAVVVQICNLKTHRFGGQFSASLKNSIGLISKFAQSGAKHNYMEELHDSPEQRFMIAEANQVYTPGLIIMDAAKIFVHGGPEAGDVVSPSVFAASFDRVAIDAAGASLLRIHGAEYPFNSTPVFELEQLSRAAELKLGAQSSGQIQLLTNDRAGANLALQLEAVLSSAPSDDKKN